jgi:hypothetical protein
MFPRLLSVLLLNALFLGAVSAQVTDAYYDAASGQIILPHLRGDGEYYYARLTLIDADTLTFQADIPSLADITPPEQVGETVNTDASQIYGTWTISGMTIDDVYVSFFEDGSYELFEDTTDEGCTTGTEYGSYQWVPSTGLLLTTVDTDGNGDCGLSHPNDGVPYRVFISDQGMQLLDHGSGVAPLEEYGLVRVSQ